MAGSSFWRRLARLWPHAVGTRPRPPLAPVWLEQLGDRTLLSGFLRAYDLPLLAEQVYPAAPAAAEGVRLDLSASSLDALRLLAGSRLGPAAEGGHGPNSGADAQGAGLDVNSPDGGGYRDAFPQGGSSAGFKKTPIELGPGNLLDEGDLGGQLQQVYVDRSEGTDLDNMEEYGKEYVATERALDDRTVLEYLLRPNAADHTDRHSTGDGSSFGGPEDDASRPDAAGTELILSDRTDGPSIARSLAAVFREELPGDEMFGENPAGKTPDVLVSYEPDLLPPQTELLPLEDGSRALVAALVAGAPEQDVAPADPSQRDAAPFGSPVGIDSGPAAGASAAEPSAVPEAPTDAAPPQAGMKPQPISKPSDAAPALPRVAPGLDAAGGDRPTLRLADAVFAVGVFSLYYFVDDFGRQVRRPGPRA